MNQLLQCRYCLVVFWAVFVAGNVFGQEVEVSGTVLDSEDTPIAGVIVSATDNVLTVTDPGGRFIVTVPVGSTLTFSSTGYNKEEIVVGTQKIINVVLLKLAELDEVVVVGYGVQQKQNITGAVDVISNKQIQDRQSPTMSQLLQGLAPAMNFGTSRFGFSPGSSLGIDIRGTGSLNGGSPHVLIDGIPGNMDYLNPEDVASISVLKDAAAAAIYGARAPYGVILITTKSGKRESKINITYSGNASIATPQRLPEMLDSYTYARVTNEAGVYGRGGRYYTNDVIDRIIAYQNGDIDYLKQFTVPDAIYFETIPLDDGLWGNTLNGNANYDWFDEYYGSGLVQKHNVSVQGGSKLISYYFSGGYFDQEGVLNYGTDTYSRLNTMGKIKVNVTDWWEFTYQPRFMKSSRVVPNAPQGNNQYEQRFHQIARTMPMQAKYDGYGNYMMHSKIPWSHYSGGNRIETTENWQNFATEIRPLANWKINADFAYRSTDVFDSDNVITVYEHLVDRSIIPSGATLPSSITQSHQSDFYWTTNVYTTYQPSLGDQHNLSFMVGTQWEFDKSRRLSVQKDNVVTSEVLSLQTAFGNPVASENLAHWSTQGYFGRLNYDFHKKYLLELNIRMDGTSRFLAGKRWGTFPSISAGWNIDQENIWKNIDHVVNRFKIRGSWGSLGNQNVSPYQDLALIPINVNQLNWLFGYGENPITGFTGTPDLVSRFLTWETATTYNIGSDLSFFNNRLQTTFDWFHRITTNMIGPTEAQPGVLGAQVPLSNNSTLSTKGWEVSLRWQNQVGKNLSYYVNANLYDNRTFVTKYFNPTGRIDDWYEGKVQGEIWGYTSNDLYRSQSDLDEHGVDLSYIWSNQWMTGDVKYEDINGDGAVNDGSRTIYDYGDLTIIGNQRPRYQYGLSAGVTFKGFDLSMLWKGTLKRDRFMGNNENMFWGFQGSPNQASLFPQHLDYYRDQEGDKYTGLYEGQANLNIGAYWPRPYLHAQSNLRNRQISTRYLQDASYIRLQNLQLGYNFNLSRWRVDKLRLYFSGENLLTITKLPRGMDPVAITSPVGDGKSYGADRILSFGLIVTY